MVRYVPLGISSVKLRHFSGDLFRLTSICWGASSVAEEAICGRDSGYAESSCCLEGRHPSGRGLRREMGSDPFGARRPSCTNSVGSGTDPNSAGVGVLVSDHLRWWKMAVTYKMITRYAKHITSLNTTCFALLPPTTRSNPFGNIHAAARVLFEDYNSSESCPLRGS